MRFSTSIDNDHTMMVSKKIIDDQKNIDKNHMHEQQSNKVVEEYGKNKSKKSTSKKSSVKVHKKKDNTKDEEKEHDFIEDYNKERYTHVFNTYEETSKFILDGICGV